MRLKGGSCLVPGHLPWKDRIHLKKIRKDHNIVHLASFQSPAMDAWPIKKGAPWSAFLPPKAEISHERTR